MTRAEKARLLASLSTSAAPTATKVEIKREATKSFEVDGVQVPYESERPTPNETNAQTNRDLLRQARARAERNDD